MRGVAFGGVVTTNYLVFQILSVFLSIKLNELIVIINQVNCGTKVEVRGYGAKGKEGMGERVATGWHEVPAGKKE